jgi:hypothetical protein
MSRYTDLRGSKLLILLRFVVEGRIRVRSEMDMIVSSSNDKFFIHPKTALLQFRCVYDKCRLLLQEIRHNIIDKTIQWKFVKSLEPPRLVHARCTDIITKENVFGQVTVRFHTQQILAIYDRFGRLMHGSEILAKDVLEYVVFEKHLSNEYGLWRLHGKIVPDWMPPKEPTAKTYRLVMERMSEEHSETKEVQMTPSEAEVNKPQAASV